MSTKNVSISTVIPVFRSKAILPELQDRLTRTLDALATDWEVILVDDGSSDGTWDVLLQLRKKDSRYKLIQLVRNHGQQHALLCGLQHATGGRVITMDDDLQNPPEEIPRLLERLDEGYEIVIGRISHHKKHSYYRNIGSRVIQRMVATILKKPKDLALSSFRALTHQAVEKIASYQGAHPYFPALMLNAIPADQIVNVDVNHDKRAYGKSTYTLGKLIRLASFLLINQSTLPLRFITLWGILLSIGALVYAAAVLLGALFFESPAAGWASLAIMVSFFSGNILLALGIFGEYVGRVLEEISRPTQFFIARKEM